MIIVAIGAYWTHVSKSLFDNEQRLLMNDIVGAEASAIERRLSRSLSTTYILAQEIKRNNGIFENFESYAEEVISTIGGVSNLQLAPSGIIRQIYPLGGNEKAIGHNILNDDDRRREAQLAVAEKRLTLAGPFELLQGGVAVIGRNPVFLNQGGVEEFWGFASALIYLDDLLDVTELRNLERRGYSYQLSRLHPDSGSVNVFARSQQALSGNSLSVAVNVPNSQWTLTMSRNPPGSIISRTFWGYLASLLVACVLVYLLYSVLQHPLKLQREITEKTQILDDMLSYDNLTGLPNRHLLSKILANTIAESEHYYTQAAFLFFDLDDFKRINDSMGHDAGDHLLKQIAERLRDAVREEDVVARLGGDEFGMLLQNVESETQVATIADEVLAVMEEPVKIESREYTISTSIGIVMIPSDGSQVPTLFQNADMAMYAAKKEGKRTFCFYNEEMQASVLQQLRIEEELQGALDNHQFSLNYQPLVDLVDDCVCGYEALIRWYHPERGMIYPDSFIPVAEETGKIVDIGYWVIRETCEFIKLRKLRGEVSVRIAVNLSTKQFNDPNLVSFITQVLEDTGVEPRLLGIEITETILMKDVGDAIMKLDQLKGKGITVSIDDFGTGYSSLAQLKRLPVDTLKIDRSFVMDMDSDWSDRMIVEGVIAMAHKLLLRVVAEGIESEKHLALLKKYGCDVGQGYLFGKPVPADDICPSHTVQSRAQG
ncbi:bifunctional diguanylate cyclase/phosphodiesterase [Motiliproteus sp. MSK22-1]|uniref:putative bifunctional diguanylate cyclase/phosphodiesterase n=1 Tax=Motiliproteus sp. MSK22-1 TaxID=1897630 RepID=UPI001E644040|nr:EAL domain-containing protein [Motiliproteus sp. MSK22-1]